MPRELTPKDIEKIVKIDEHIEVSDNLESDMQFKLGLLSEYRSKLVSERNSITT
jgi:hypothetical protein